MQLADYQIAEFATNGIIHLSRAVPKKATDAAREAVLAELTRLGYRSGGKWHTKKLDGVLPFQVAGKISAALTPGPAIGTLLDDDLMASLNRLARSRLKLGHPHWQLLVTPPQKQPWSIPEHGWHVDAKPTKTGGIPGVQVFVLLDDLASRGGATMAIKGSHLTKGMAPSVETVVEMCGKAGDAYLMDMRLQHAPSINATDRARMMATARFMTAT